jgi:hypothetical protein
MSLRTGVGVVTLTVWYGKDPGRKQWGCPIRQRWGLGPHQELSPGLEDKLAFTVTETLCYRGAAAVARKWGSPVDEATVHALTQKLGGRAEQQTQGRLEQVPQELTPRRAASKLAVFMMDGWQARYRGPGWGKKRTKKKRVEWHEVRVGIFYLHEQAGRTAGDRGIISDKVAICWQGEPAELGRRLQAEALRRGLGRAEHILVVGDGAAWIWNVKQDRWATAEEILDFYHASEHLWELGRALLGENQAKEWVEGRLHELRHGEEEKFLTQIAELKAPRGERGKTVREQKTYFANQSERMNYKEIADRGWPIGSGAVESACSGEQNRLKRRGQFWTKRGLGNLAALIGARENDYWDELWFAE